ncbi:MAG: rRNA maturation RNase YbeY [Zetaproteobacteria bacterium CG_4_9_14_3_um_filter_49_83]|nr:MAG: rRNA maturation RNase YbeY [Zetaproteobacteria bacterium CG1_02_49_23]PIQ29962.1 MAG: rRNA maturation RNase YbeY [Zetaproteobacteria bacterium CG17_big_fil_post_rev_8_21_14_2_50_50_13]PIV31459.1 MAG: rRNA maturation RNase YbeY [Zetaproteobacteria bacterium CG02_land_8_20_14_3_00_50_9]PIY55019.1 MAG: rRNA maturation RNase YbeY [Zetaproteobacteria bacterium CG_4_10_14_0_8_um_filter_49_80]PJA36529.1 MAG: rRNA maturation RNase YbeY [Zetaproteobacteria bacterium CG_4_9_14_3_um_filter_49_83]
MSNEAVCILLDEGLTEDAEELPDELTINTAVQLSFQRAMQMLACATSDLPEVCLRFAVDVDVQQLNEQWRGKNAVTDVLSFPMQEHPPFNVQEPLGDIILALPFVIQEARQRDLKPSAHIIHLIVHGVLHLCGFDHIDDPEAEQMQALEADILLQLGLHHPYPDNTQEADSTHV